jgi:plasmid stabilization system protein ParE
VRLLEVECCDLTGLTLSAARFFRTLTRWVNSWLINARIRKIIYRPYRIVYRLDVERQLVEIARVWHAARGAPSV